MRRVPATADTKVMRVSNYTPRPEDTRAASKQAYLEALSATASHERSAHRIGLSYAAVKKWRRADPMFDSACVATFRQAKAAETERARNATSKRCSACSATKPVHPTNPRLSGFSRNRQCRDGYSSICKTCAWATQKKLKATQKLARHRTSTQLCSQCGEVKFLAEFVNPDSGRLRSGGGSWWCNDCADPAASHYKCSRCKERKAASEFSFSAHRANKHKDQCRQCSLDYERELQARDRERFSEMRRKQDRARTERNQPEYWSRKLLSNARQRARKGDLPFELDREWIEVKLRRNRCEVTGLPFTFIAGQGKGANRENAFGPSIDKIDPEGGYTRDNCRVVVNIYNTARGSAEDEALTRLCRAVLSREQHDVDEVAVVDKHTARAPSPEAARARERLKTVDGRAEMLYQGLLGRSKGWRNLVDLDRDWIAERIRPGVCQVTGIPFEFVLGHRAIENLWTPSVDKIDPEGGYTRNNCRVVVTLYNRAKQVWTDEDVRRLAEAVCAKEKSA